MVFVERVDYMRKDCLDKKLSNNILSLSQIAAEAKKNNPSVINATIGMLNDSNDDFYTFKAVSEVLKTISYYDSFSYADTDGGDGFKDAVLNWIFGKYTSSFKQLYNVGVVATPGGSGAISTTFENYLNFGDKVMVPSVMWETYITIAKERGCGVEKYDLYDSESNFNLNSIKESIIKLMPQQENIILVINDPCHNPTGFCMTDKDYDDLINLLNEFDYPFVLLMDVAYFDFYDVDGDIIRSRFHKLSKLNEKVLINFAFSASKTFGIYGLRIGANILLSKDENEITNFNNAISYTARANWGSSSRLGISLVEKLLSTPSYYEMFKSEVRKVALMLQKRSDAFIIEANRVGLEMLPYERGFFVCVPANDPVLLMNKLHEYDVYVVVTKTCIRIALCAINEIEAKQLPQIILKAKKELEGSKTV